MAEAQSGSSGAWLERIQDGPCRERTLRFLRRAEALGCSVAIPPSVKPYLNVRPPMGSTKRGRVASVHTGTGHIEFQSGSAPRLAHLAAFHRIGGTKVTLNLRTDGDLADALAALDIEVAASLEI